MAVPILVLRNIAHEGPGIFSSVAKQRGFALDDVDLEAGEDPLALENYSAVVVCGGPDSANDDTEKMKKEVEFVREAIERGVPYFGICLGMQILAKAAGAAVIRAEAKEIGFKDPEGEQFRIDLTAAGLSDSLFNGCAEAIDVFQLHGETVDVNDNENIELLGTGKGCRNQAIKVGSCAYGIQSHVEVTKEMFEEWLMLDPDLKSNDAALLRKEFAAIYDDYVVTAECVFNNFLDIVESQVSS